MDRCECSDPGCPVHPQRSHCQLTVARLLFRIDMQDETGTLFCDGCAEDAWSSGLFNTTVPGQASRWEDNI